MRRRTFPTPALTGFAVALIGAGLMTPASARAEEKKDGQAVSPLSSAQRGGAAGARTPSRARSTAPANFRAILEPVITTRDLGVMIRDVTSDEGQRLVLESIIADYETAFAEGVAPLREALEKLRPQGPSEEERARLREEAREQMEQLREEIRQARESARGGDDAAREAIEARMREFRSQIGGGVRPEAPKGAELEAILATAAPLAAAWNEQREQLTTDVFANLEAMFFDGTEREKWADAVQTWRRRSTREAELQGEGVDLISTLDRMRLDDQFSMALSPIMDAYADALDKALVERNRTVRNTTADMEFAILRGDQSTAESRMSERMTQHVAVRDVNDEYIDKIAQAVDGAMGDRLHAELLEKAYPRAFRPTATHRMFASAKQISSLEPSVREAVIQLETAFLAAMTEANEAIVVGARELEPNQTGEIVSRRIAQATGVPAARNPDPLLPLFKERLTVERAFADQLKALLTPEQIAKASGKGARAANDPRRNNPRRGAIPRDDPRNFSNNGGAGGTGGRGGGTGGRGGR